MKTKIVLEGFENDKLVYDGDLDVDEDLKVGMVFCLDPNSICRITRIHTTQTKNGTSRCIDAELIPCERLVFSVPRNVKLWIICLNVSFMSTLDEQGILLYDGGFLPLIQHLLGENNSS